MAGADGPGQAPLAPGWTSLAYSAPTPGSYDLPALGDAADGAVLDTDGRRRRLHEVFGDKIVVLSFIYRSCPDVNGCPLANYVLKGLQRRIRDDPALGARVRLVSMSFDPARDTPEVMRRYGAEVASDGGDWRFLTAASKQSLAPILRAYGQAVSPDGAASGTLSHVLRVYLIDRDKRIRNIYSSSFLHADLVTSDLLTLLQEEATQRASGREPRAAHAGTASPAESSRKPPLGLPPLPVPPDNQLTRARVALGRTLFFDRRLSRNRTISCAMCHVPDQGFTSNEMATAVGIEGKTVRRNAPTLYNAAYARLLFHDGRETVLEQQIWGPLLASNEMGNPSVGFVLDTIRSLPEYRDLFENAFATRAPTMETLGKALASYERTLVSAASPFDRWRFGKEKGAISAAAEEGFRLFAGKANCAHCHAVGDDYALFTDQELHNTGVGYRQTMAQAPASRRVQVAPGTFVAMDPRVIADASEAPPSDLGRYEITERPEDRWKYKTPSLRNVALTAPYMHDGSLATLRDVVAFYNAGGVPNELLDPAIKPLGLDDGEQAALVAFLESLTGDNVSAIVAEALAAPIGDPQ